MADMAFWYAEDVKVVANPMITNRLPELSQAKFVYLFKEKCSKKAGKLVYGVTRHASPRENFFLDGCDYIVEIGADGWQELNPHQREALIYHLLCYCHVDVDDETNEYTYGLKSPEIAEFADVISRYGFWHPDLAKFGALVKTVKFEDPAPVDTKKKTKDAPALLTENA